MRASNHNVYFAWTDSSFPAISRPFCPCINARRPSSCVGDYLRYLTCPAFPYLEPVNARSFQQKRTFWHPRWIACHRDRVSLLFPSLGHPRAMTLIFAPVDLHSKPTVTASFFLPTYSRAPGRENYRGRILLRCCCLSPSPAEAKNFRHPPAPPLSHPLLGSGKEECFVWSTAMKVPRSLSCQGDWLTL